jgi:hypothetical protein
MNNDIGQGVDLKGILKVGSIYTLYDLMTDFNLIWLMHAHTSIEQLQTSVLREYDLNLNHKSVQLEMQVLSNGVQMIKLSLSQLPSYGNYFPFTKKKLTEAERHINTYLKEGSIYQTTVPLNTSHLRGLTSHMTAIKTAFKEDCEKSLFIVAEPKDAEFFTEEKPFGDAVYNAFEAYREDIKDSSECFALGKHNAGLYYAIGVLEKCMRELARRAGHKDWANMDWGGIYDKVNKQIEGWKAKAKTKTEKELLTEIVGVLSQYWRLNKNRVDIAHRKIDYEPEMALLIYGIIKDTVSHFVTIKKSFPTSLKALA